MKSLLVLTALYVFVLSACAPAASNAALAAPVHPLVHGPSRAFPTGSIAAAGETQPPGPYRTPKWFLLPFTFETTEAYRGIGEIVGEGQLFGLLQGKGHLPANQLLFWVLGPNVSTEDALFELYGTSQLHFNTEKMVTVAGIAGTQFDAAGEGSIPAFGMLLGVPFDWDLSSPQVQIRFILLPVRDRMLIIYIETLYDDFEIFLENVEPVLRSIKFDR